MYTLAENDSSGMIVGIAVVVFLGLCGLMFYYASKGKKNPLQQTALTPASDHGPTELDRVMEKNRKKKAEATEAAAPSNDDKSQSDKPTTIAVEPDATIVVKTRSTSRPTEAEMKSGRKDSKAKATTK